MNFMIGKVFCIKFLMMCLVKRVSEHAWYCNFVTTHEQEALEMSKIIINDLLEFIFEIYCSY